MRVDGTERAKKTARERTHARRAWTLAFAILWLMTSRPALRAQAAWQIDPTFGTGGTTITNFVGGKDSANAIAIQADGKILVAGSVALPNETSGRFAVARYTRDGALDTEFGNGGVATAFSQAAEARALFVQADGKILAAGTVRVGEAQEFAVARFLSTGAPDQTFGEQGDGTVTTGFGTVQDFDVQDTASAIVVQPDGKIVVAGGGRLVIPNQPTVANFNLARYHPDGRLDVFFGNGGRQVADFGDGDELATAVVFDHNEEIVAIGTATVDGTPRVALARFDIFGKPDPTYDKVIVDSSMSGGINAVRQHDGRFVVVGRSAGDLAVLRIHPSGAPDASFGNGTGLVTTDLGGPADSAFGVVVLPDDAAIIVVGQASAPDAGPANDFAIVRYTSDGMPDTTFAPGGTLRTDFANGVDAARGVSLQTDGKIVVAGVTSNGVDDATQDVAFARYAPGPEADLRLTKSASATTVNVGERFSYTLTLANAGPGDAAGIIITDTLPRGATVISCEAPPDGECSGTGSSRRIRYPTLPNGATRTITLVTVLDATVPDSATLENTARVQADTFDPDRTSNDATVTITARNIPHTLRFFLHGTDVPGTASGFTMNLTPTASQTIRLNLLQAPTWFSDPLLTGTAAAGSTFRVVRPCSIGLGVLVSYRLAKVDAAGGAEQPLGQASGLLTLCTGQETVTIPVATPVTFNNERLRLTISSTVAATLTLQLGEGTFLEMTSFSGIP